MEEQQYVHLQPGRIARLTAMWQTIDKKKWAKIGGVVVTIGALVVAGVCKSVPGYLAHKE
jgi:hypothetical protein